MARDPVEYPDPIGRIELPGYDETELGWVEWCFDVVFCLLGYVLRALVCILQAVWSSLFG